MEEESEFWQPLRLSCLAGASTCVGAAVVFCQPQQDHYDHNTKRRQTLRVVPPGTMTFSLALAGSVMVTVSIISILPECVMDEDNKLISIWSAIMFWRVLFFVFGCGLYFVLSTLMSEPEELLEQHLRKHVSGIEDDEEKILMDLDKGQREGIESTQGSPRNRLKRTQSTESINSQSLQESADKSKPKDKLNSLKAWAVGNDLSSKEQKKAWRVAMLLFVSLLAHNFPEGLAVAASTLEDKNLGITVTIGIMIHNIPEGIAIAVPCLSARPDQPWLSFLLASVSGLAEPFGAFVALMVLKDFHKSDSLVWSLENILAFVAGIMITVAMMELFPEASRHSSATSSHFWYGSILGVLVMVMTELYLPKATKIIW